MSYAGFPCYQSLPRVSLKDQMQQRISSVNYHYLTDLSTVLLHFKINNIKAKREKNESIAAWSILELKFFRFYKLLYLHKASILITYNIPINICFLQILLRFKVIKFDQQMKIICQVCFARDLISSPHT